jgi:hypothetical protein
MAADLSIAGLSWSNGLVGVEPQTPPNFDESPPDPTALRQRATGEMAETEARAVAADAVVRRLGPPVRMGVFATAAGVVLGIALLIGLASRGPSGFYKGVDDKSEGPYKVLVYALFFGPFIGTAAYLSLRKLRGIIAPFGFKKMAALCIAALVAGAATFGAGWVLLPLVIGPLLLLSRPLISMPDGSSLQVTPSVLGAYRAARKQLAEARGAAAQIPASLEEQVAQEVAAYEHRRMAFADELARWSPFSPVGPLSDQDLLVVGGTAAERGDLVHNLTAAWALVGPVWIFDLHSDGASHAAYTGATQHERTIGVIDGTNADAVVAALDKLGSTSQRHSPLIEVLSAGMAAEATAGSVARKREITDTLRRIGAVLATGRDSVRVVDFHLAMETLLSGRTAATTGADDFGLGGNGQAAEHAHLSADEARRLREAFTDDERSSYFREWSEIRTKLGALLHGRSDEPAQIRWGPGCDVSVAYVSAAMPRDDRELRSALLLEHHIQMLRQAGASAPACLIVPGCDDAPREMLQELSKVADTTGVALVLVFADRANEVLELARGRRALAAFGGLGSEAAEQLSNGFGHDWQWRVQSYQASWSESTARSRSETSGRNWGWSDSESISEGWNEGSSLTIGESISSSSSHGHSAGTSSSRSRSGGGSESETRGETDTTGTSGAATQAREYEQAVRGVVLSRLPPYTMLLRVATGEVKYVDIGRHVELPPVSLAQIERIEVRRHRPAGPSGNLPAGLPSPPAFGPPQSQ